MEKGHDCYSCHWIRGLAGTVHVQCGHPDAAADQASSFTELMSIFASVQRVAPVTGQTAADCLGVKMNPHGVSRGWCNWPWRFDPVWIDNCDGFIPKKALAKQEKTGG